jgi:hypothetical protein
VLLALSGTFIHLILLNVAARRSFLPGCGSMQGAPV